MLRLLWQKKNSPCAQSKTNNNNSYKQVVFIRFSVRLRSLFELNFQLCVCVCARKKKSLVIFNKQPIYLVVAYGYKKDTFAIIQLAFCEYFEGVGCVRFAPNRWLNFLFTVQMDLCKWHWRRRHKRNNSQFVFETFAPFHSTRAMVFGQIFNAISNCQTNDRKIQFPDISVFVNSDVPFDFLYLLIDCLW